MTADFFFYRMPFLHKITPMVFHISIFGRHFVKQSEYVTSRKKLFVANNKLECLSKNENSRKLLSTTVILMEIGR